ncbi:class Ib ribonucleoside-diphosphate reductase assembly flavoprotein NrdI [Enterococcus sp. DIV1298c]|nr:class Ib ribonucleoside-diphosphate reductase assembly flavoprotein NrdI [Enterococcus sp. DIV1298c]
MRTINIFYISLSGNTTNFIERLDGYIMKKYRYKVLYTNVRNIIKENPEDIFLITDPYFLFLPAYLEGGNGINNGFKEILTTPLKKLVAYKNNATFCYGIVGSGNRNFNKQFCLTAYQYSSQFNFPMIDEFELRGNDEDIKRIGNKLITIINNNQLEVSK